MLVVLYIIFFAFISCTVAYKTDKEIVEIFPAVFSAFIIVLYLLAFFNRMWLIDAISIAVIILMAAFVIIRKDGQLVKNCLKKLFRPSVLIFITVVLLGVILLSERGIYSDDDWNFWATDVKTIYYLQGFSSKGFNTVPLYGDYPPASQLMEAWMMHIHGKWSEGILFSAYFMGIIIFTAPILKNIPAKIIPVAMVTGWMFLIYSAGPNMMFDISADIFMGTVYGSVILLTFYWKKKTTADYIMLSLMLSVLVLVKSVGIQWAAFAVIFILLNDIFYGKAGKNNLSLVIPFVFWASWSVFCKIAERTTYLVESLKSVVSYGNDKVLFETYSSDMVKSFFTALKMPQQKSVFGIGLSIIAFFVIFILALQILKKFGLIDTKENRIITSFIIISGIVEYAILLGSVLTIFLHEFWYTDPFFMLILLKRYGCPFIISGILLINGILFERIKNREIRWFDKKLSAVNSTQITICAAVLLQIAFSPIGQEVEKYVTYRGDVTKELVTYNEAICESDMSVHHKDLIKTVELIKNVPADGKEKILVIHDETEWSKEEGNNRGLRYYSAPNPIVVKSILEHKSESLEDMLADNNYTAVCFITDDENCSNFKYLFKDNMDIEAYIIYKIDSVNKKILYN